MPTSIPRVARGVRRGRAAATSASIAPVRVVSPAPLHTTMAVIGIPGPGAGEKGGALPCAGTGRRGGGTAKSCCPADGRRLCGRTLSLAGIGLREREASLRRLSGGCFSVALPCVCTRGVTGAGSEARHWSGLHCLRDWRRISSGEVHSESRAPPERS